MSTYSTESDSDATLPGPDYASSTASDRREESNIPPQPKLPQFGMFGPVTPSHTPQERNAARAMLELRNPVVHGANNPGGTTNGNQDSDSGSSPGPETQTSNASGDSGECAARNSAQAPTTTTTSGSAPNGDTQTTSNPLTTSNPGATTTTTPTNDGAPTVTTTSTSTTSPVTANHPASTNNLASDNPTTATASTGNPPASPATGPVAAQGSRTITLSQYHAMMRARAARQ